jgi:hypothetical protein
LTRQHCEVFAFACACEQLFGVLTRDGLGLRARALFDLDQDVTRAHLLVQPGVTMLLALVFCVDVFLIRGAKDVQLGVARREFLPVKHRRKARVLERDAVLLAHEGVPRLVFADRHL